MLWRDISLSRNTGDRGNSEHNPKSSLSWWLLREQECSNHVVSHDHGIQRVGCTSGEACAKLYFKPLTAGTDRWSAEQGRSMEREAGKEAFLGVVRVEWGQIWPKMGQNQQRTLPSYTNPFLSQAALHSWWRSKSTHRRGWDITWGKERNIPSNYVAWWCHTCNDWAAHEMDLQEI